MSFVLMVFLELFAAEGAPLPKGTPPPLPKITKDVLPGEGWAKGTYRLNGDTVLYDGWTAKRHRIAIVRTGASVIVLGGLSEVIQPDVVRITSAIPGLELNAGDKLLRYMERGEGNADFWAKGQWFTDANLGFIQNADGSGCQSACKAREVQTGKKVWWFHVRLADGRVGWRDAFNSLRRQ